MCEQRAQSHYKKRNSWESNHKHLISDLFLRSRLIQPKKQVTSSHKPNVFQKTASKLLGSTYCHYIHFFNATARKLDVKAAKKMGTVYINNVKTS